MPLLIWLELCWRLRLLRDGYCYETTHIQADIYDSYGAGVGTVLNAVGVVGSVDMQIATVIQPGYWWYDPNEKAPKRKLHRDIKPKILKCVQEWPGLTSDRIADKTGTTINYCREILKQLINAKLIRKVYEGNGVITYWSVNA